MFLSRLAADGRRQSLSRTPPLSSHLCEGQGSRPPPLVEVKHAAAASHLDPTAFYHSLPFLVSYMWFFHLRLQTQIPSTYIPPTYLQLYFAINISSTSMLFSFCLSVHMSYSCFLSSPTEYERGGGGVSGVWTTRQLRQGQCFGKTFCVGQLRSEIDMRHDCTQGKVAETNCVLEITFTRLYCAIVYILI